MQEVESLGNRRLLVQEVESLDHLRLLAGERGIGMSPNEYLCSKCNQWVI